jgi:hypothetical protein
LALAAVDQDQVRPQAFVALGVFLHHAAKAAGENFAHHGEIIVGLGLLDIPFAVLALDEAFGARNDHRAQGMGALNVAVVIDLHPLGRFGKVKEFGHLAPDPSLGAGFGGAAVQSLDGITRGLIDQFLAITPLRNGEFNLAACRFLQRLAQQLRLGQIAVEQDHARGRHFLIKLRKEALHHLTFLQPFGMGGEEGTVAPVLAAADEEGLDRDLPFTAAMAKMSALGRPSAWIA